MVTEVIMQRELLGDFVRQKSKSGFFNANDLMRVGNKWRANNGLKIANIQNYFKQDGTKEFMSSVESKYGIIKTSNKGRNGEIWIHPLIFIDLALWLNPKLKIEVYEWLFDNLLMYRNDSGDSFKKMCGALLIRANKTDFVSNIQKLGKLIQVECGVSDWNNATQEQLRLRDRIHENIALLADVLNNNKEAIRLGIYKAKNKDNC